MPRSTTSRRPLTFEDLRAIALGLPEVVEILTWGTDVTFRIGKKIFAMGADGATAVSIKASLDSQAELVEMDPATFQPSAYVGRFGWVTVDLERVDPDLLRSLLEEAWRRTAPRRLAASLAATPE